VASAGVLTLGLMVAVVLDRGGEFISVDERSEAVFGDVLILGTIAVGAAALIFGALWARKRAIQDHDPERDASVTAAVVLAVLMVGTWGVAALFGWAFSMPVRLVAGEAAAPPAMALWLAVAGAGIGFLVGVVGGRWVQKRHMIIAIAAVCFTGIVVAWGGYDLRSMHVDGTRVGPPLWMRHLPWIGILVATPGIILAALGGRRLTQAKEEAAIVKDPPPPPPPDDSERVASVNG
jgi:hypothetical protein